MAPPDSPSRPPVVPVDDLRPLCATCCAMASLYPRWPHCVGCYGQQVVGPMHAEQVLCKTSQESTFWCTTSRLECMCRRESTCCRSICQLFCLDLRFGIPHSSQHPCICTICFLTVNAENKWMVQCCATVLELLERDVTSLAQPLRGSESLPSAPALMSVDHTPGPGETLPMAMVIHFDSSQLTGSYSHNTSTRDSAGYATSDQRGALLASPVLGTRDFAPQIPPSFP